VSQHCRLSPTQRYHTVSKEDGWQVTSTRAHLQVGTQRVPTELEQGWIITKFPAHTCKLKEKEFYQGIKSQGLVLLVKAGIASGRPESARTTPFMLPARLLGEALFHNCCSHSFKEVPPSLAPPT
jgi:hypothetical protein